MINTSESLSASRKDPAGSMAEPRRDQLIAGVAALLASLAIHAVLIFAGYVLFNFYFSAPAESPPGILFAARVEPSAERFQAHKLRDTIETEDLVDIGADNPDVLAFNPSETENPIRLPDMTRGNVKFKPVGPEFGPSASDSLFTGPEALRLSRMEGFGESRGSGDILGGAGGIGSPGSSLGAKLEKDFKNKDILLVWLVDSSPSLFDQVDMLKGQIKPLFDRLNKYSPGRLSMTVISYGERAEPALEKPTRDPAAVMAALAAIKKKSYQRVKQKALARYRNPRAKVAPSVENTMHALCQAATLRAGDGRQIVIALLTDERGDDAAGWQYALKALRAKGIPLFVFGPTTRIFSERRPELLVLQDDAFISDKPRNPHGYVLMRGWGDLGSAEPGREPCCRNWGAALLDAGLEQPAMAGPFELSALVKLTGGKYYFIDDGRIVDAAILAKLPGDVRSMVRMIADDRRQNNTERFDLSLMSKYVPEYSAEARKGFMNSFGKRLLGIIEEVEMLPNLRTDFASTREIKDANRMAADNLKIINRAIKRVSSLKVGPEAPRRWQAYRDLFLAQLHLARYNLVEYIKTVERHYGKKLSPMPDRDGFIHRMVLQRTSLKTTSKDLSMADAVDIPTLEPVRTVIRNPRELNQFLKDRAVLGENQERPSVNFASHMLIVVTLGRVYSPDAEVEILGVTRTGNALEVAVREVNPKVASPDLDLPYFPSHVVVAPRSTGEPKFVSLEEWSRACVAREAPLLKGGRISAEYRRGAKVAVGRVLRKYKGAPWAEIAKSMKNPGSFKIVDVKRKAGPPETKSKPGPETKSKSGPRTPEMPGDF